MNTEIEKSDYQVLADGVLEVDRIVSREDGNLVFRLRARNSSSKSIKIFSFVVADFVIPQKAMKVLENGWLQCSEVGFKTLEQKTIPNKVFLQRDSNPYSFRKEFGYLEDSVVSEWFTLIKLFGKDLFIGAVTTADQFAQVNIRKEEGGTRIRVMSQYDGLTLNPGQIAYSEKIFFAVGEENKIKSDFAKSLAKHMNVKKVVEPIRAMCNSYYWHGNVIDESLINKELEALEKLPEKLNLDYFQIDAGYTKYFGDWLDYKEKFPHGFEPIIKRIKLLGYKPAIWLSPFAISPTTKLHDHYKEWFLRDIDKKHIGDLDHLEGRFTSPFDKLFNKIDLEVLDPTLPEVQNYLAKVLTHFKDLGFELFKLDFMYPVCLAEKYSKPVTRAQALRIGVENMRRILGDSLILTCITQISPLVGLADFVRTGIDTLNPFVCGIPGVDSLINNFMLKKNLEEGRDRAFLNGVVWRADPDMMVFRKDTGIDNKTINTHKKFAKENNMCLWVGDSVAKMDDKERIALLKFFNNEN